MSTNREGEEVVPVWLASISLNICSSVMVCSQCLHFTRRDKIRVFRPFLDNGASGSETTFYESMANMSYSRPIAGTAGLAGISHHWEPPHNMVETGRRWGGYKHLL